MEALWPELDPAAAANNLHQVVHVARRALGADAVALRDELLTLSARRRRGRLRTRGRRGAPRGIGRRLSRGAVALRRRAAAGESLRRLGRRAARGARAAARGAGRRDRGRSDGGERSARACPRRRARSSVASHELRELSALLARTRLLTLAGAGGAGKTRLALELAREVERSFADGAAFVELAPVSDGRLGRRRRRGGARRRRAARPHAAGGRRRLPRAARRCCSCSTTASTCCARGAMLADALLRAAPGLTILATSREPLRVAGEVVFRVPSMTIPDPEQHLEPEQLLRYEAVRPVRRARHSGGARVRDRRGQRGRRRAHLLSPRRPAARAGARRRAARRARARRRSPSASTTASACCARAAASAPTRQQTLAATLQWSHELLERRGAAAAAPPRGVRRRLRARRRRGGLRGRRRWSRARSPTCSRGSSRNRWWPSRRRGRERRYRLLETVRLYARERLQAAGESGRAGRAPRELGAGAGRARSAARRGWTARRRTCAPRSTRCWRATPSEALRYCVALTARSGCAGSTSHEAHRRFDAGARRRARSARRCGRRRCSRPSAIDLRSRRAGVRCWRTRRRASRSPPSSATPQAQWRALQLLGEFAVGYDHGIARRSSCSSGALELARREGLRGL